MNAHMRAVDFNPDYDPGLKPDSTVVYRPRGAIISNPRILNGDAQSVNLLERNARYLYSYNVEFLEPAENVGFGMLIKTVTGLELGGGTTAFRQDLVLKKAIRGSSYEVVFGFQCVFTPGVYFINAGVINAVTMDYYHRILDAVAFRVKPEAERQVMTGLIDCGVAPAITAM